jgi:hypothetical protein
LLRTVFVLAGHYYTGSFVVFASAKSVSPLLTLTLHCSPSLAIARPHKVSLH